MYYIRQTREIKQQKLIFIYGSGACHPYVAAYLPRLLSTIRWETCFFSEYTGSVIFPGLGSGLSLLALSRLLTAVNMLLTSVMNLTPLYIHPCVRVLRKQNDEIGNIKDKY